jgi:NADPH:quinone reductase-like Zn-dependent oxidoreductase
MARFVAWARLVSGQCVVKPDDATHDEAAIGDVVRVTGGPLLEDAVDQEGADFERVFTGGGAGGIACFGVGHALDRAEDD